MRMLQYLLCMTFVASLSAAAIAQCADDRWFATGTLRGASHVLGPFKSLPECDEARKHDAARFSFLSAAESAKLPGLRSRVLSAAKDGRARMRLAQAELDGHAEAADVYQELAFLWSGGSICERR
nr:hypothetical protein [uncultured Rhodopila sp.]